MTPAHVHMHVLLEVNAGKLLISVFGAPGVHGAGTTGTHGTGEPRAAMTAGLAGAVHIPNGGMFAIGVKSMIVAAGLFSAFTGGPLGITMSVDGATPNEHLSIAPMFTCGGMHRR
jgi:hypothetical protein